MMFHFVRVARACLVLILMFLMSTVMSVGTFKMCVFSAAEPEIVFQSM